MADDYKVSDEETRKIAERFFELHPALKVRWNHRVREPYTPLGDNQQHCYTTKASDEELKNLKWTAAFAEPTSNTFELTHSQVLDGLHWCLHHDEYLESEPFRQWLMETPAAARKVEDLEDWAVSRVVQAAVFDGEKFPYGGHSRIAASFERAAQA
jgi:hypothetical protein